MNLIQREDSLALLSKICHNSKDALVLISPWISKRELVQLVDLANLTTKIRVITRWPLPTDSPGYIDIDAIKYALSDERIELAWSSSEDDLHAKVYFSSGVGALVTSANLTGKGFPSPTHSGRANIELGVFVQDQDVLSDLDDWIGNLSIKTARSDDLDRLTDWEMKYQVWAKNIPPDAPFLKRPNWNPQRAVLAALESVKGSPGLARYEHIPIGRGVASFNLFFTEDSPAYPIRVLTSVHNEDGKYHFDISKHDVGLWQVTRRKKRPSIRGVVLSAVIKHADGSRLFTAEDFPPVFIPFDFLFGPGNLPITKFKSRKGAKGKSRLVYIEKSEGGWILTCTSLKAKNKSIRIPLKRCLGKTTQMRETESWRLRVPRVS